MSHDLTWPKYSSHQNKLNLIINSFIITIKTTSTLLRHSTSLTKNRQTLIRSSIFIWRQEIIWIRFKTSYRAIWNKSKYGILEKQIWNRKKSNWWTGIWFLKYSNIRLIKAINIRSKMGPISYTNIWCFLVNNNIWKIWLLKCNYSYYNTVNCLNMSIINISIEPFRLDIRKIKSCAFINKWDTWCDMVIYVRKWEMESADSRQQFEWTGGVFKIYSIFYYNDYFSESSIRILLVQI